MAFLSKVICVILIFLLTWNEAWGTNCDRMITGDKGVVFSYNFPLDYEKGISCIYRHNFHGLEKSEINGICLQFKRFNLSQSDYLLINGKKYTNRGEMTLANLCVPYTGVSFVMEFYSYDTPTNFGYPGFYATYHVTTEKISSTSNPLNENTSEGMPTDENVFCNSPDLFQCFDGKKCISTTLQCNEEFDCDDQSDEAYATARCEGVEGQKSYFQAINISSLPLDLSKYRMKITKGNWIAESKSDDSDFGPDGPHVSGYYLRTDFGDSSSAELEVEVKARGEYQGWSCLTFWYNIYGQGSGQLNVRWSEYDNILWTRFGNVGQKWHKAQVQRTPFYWKNKITFEANKREEERSQIAIQDISVMPGNCNLDSDATDDISITFEETAYQWQLNGYTSSYNYSNFNRGPPGAAQGNLYLGERYRTEPMKLTSPLVTKMGSACLAFKAFASGDDTYINYQINSGNEVTFGYFSVVGSAGWQQFKINIVRPTRAYKIMITSNREGVFYDDLVFLNELCQELDIYECEKEEYMCTGSLECIPRSRAVCNGVQDCPNADDELLCASCNDGAFLCDDKRCVPRGSRCDGIAQCWDNTDEEDCNALNGGQIAGIVIGCILGVAAIVALVVLVHSRSRKGTDQHIRKPNLPQTTISTSNTADHQVIPVPAAYVYQAANDSLVFQPAYAENVIKIANPSN